MKSCTRFTQVPKRPQFFNDSAITGFSESIEPLLALCVAIATLMIITIGIIATPIVNKICLKLTLPINNKSNEVAPVNNAFDKFAGMIKPQIINTGIITGKNPFLKSLITSCFLLSTLERYINKANFATSLL